MNTNCADKCDELRRQNLWYLRKLCPKISRSSDADEHG